MIFYSHTQIIAFLLYYILIQVNDYRTINTMNIGEITRIRKTEHHKEEVPIQYEDNRDNDDIDNDS